MKKVAIIGAGACGLLLANLLKDDFDVTLIEKNNKLGKKILASGNGKCNFTNIGDYNNKYNNEFAHNLVNKFSYEKVIKYLSSLGLVYRIDTDNRAYPLSESSATFLAVLKQNLKKVKILLDSRVTRIENNLNTIKVYYSDKKEDFNYVICASGSEASNLGSEHAYNYLKEYGIKFTKINPSLTPIKVRENLKKIDGVRVKCLVKLLKNDSEIYKEHGEVLFKENGLSGIVIYNMSSMINRDSSSKYKICLDLLNDAKNNVDSEMLYGVVNPKILEYLKENGIIDITSLTFNVTGLFNKDYAQVISGGVDLNQINEDLSLKDNKSIYFGGEVLDCDGMCGGYNLQFAFSCALAINESLRRKINE